MRALLRRDKFREFLVAHPDAAFIRGSCDACPIAQHLRDDNKDREVGVDTVHFWVGGRDYMLPPWAARFIEDFDYPVSGRALALGRLDSRYGFTKEALQILDAIPLGPEDEDDDEHPGRAMLDESPPHEPDETSPDYDEELEDSEAEPDYEEDDE